jgi:hypothetical protein
VTAVEDGLTASLRKGAPFAGYRDFEDCVARNSEKRDPSSYCGEIKHRTEDKAPANGGNAHTAASGLDQVQQVTDPDNVPSPEDDQLPEGVAFPLGDSLGEQWVTSPAGPRPKARQGAKSDLPPQGARMMGHADALDGRKPRHQEDFGHSKIQHGRYLSGWNGTAGLMHGMVGRAPMTADEYEKSTGRRDLHGEYLAAYAEGRKMHTAPGTLLYAEQRGTTAALHTADAWSQPRSTTDDLHPPYNSPQTTPPDQPGGADYAAGEKAGRADRASGERPAFADSSPGVSPYVKGYSEGYAGAQAPAGPMDAPRSLGGDSGQAANAQEAQRAFQVSKASRTASLRRASATFAPDALFDDPDFRKGYLFATRWQPGQRLVSQGSARFEAGLYSGITDAPGAQQEWLAAHAMGTHPDLAHRIERHVSFTRKHARRAGIQATGAYVQRQAATSTDLITDGPGTSPDPMGATPLNGPGTQPPMGGLTEAAAPGGAPPYQGAPPLSGGPVVPDDVMGKPQRPEQPDGPFTQTFSGAHPENATLAPVAPNSANQPGYSNKPAYEGDRGTDRVASQRLAAFRARVQHGARAMAGGAQ